MGRPNKQGGVVVALRGQLRIQLFCWYLLCCPSTQLKKRQKERICFL